VLAFETETPRAPLAVRLRSVGGTFGTWKAQTVASARGDRLSGFVSGSWFGTDGFRQHSAAETRLFTGRADYLLSGSSTLGVSVSLADAPKAENPGALTLAEYEARRDSAAANNINRGADKAVSQEQVAVRWRWAGASGAEAGITAFGLHRDLVNPLATPPPSGTTGPDVGTWNAIGRYAGGLRATGMVPAGRSLRLGGGVDVQAMRDDRRNERSFSGEPSGEVLADQRETVREVGLFAQAHWEPSGRVLLLGAVRGDFVRFRVIDRYLGDGEDQSGTRTFESLSGSVGASVAASPAATLYANLSTSFETPTTTELVNQASGATGFNPDLGPQRTLTAELGARGGLGPRVDYTVAVFTGRIRDAIVQAREVSGRAFFANAGRLRVRGVEASLGARPLPWLTLGGAYTFADNVFTEYRVQNGAVVDTLDGKRQPGVPRHFLRLSAAATWSRVTLELDQMSAGYLYADDPNTIRVDGWGAGVTAIRASARFPWGAAELAPFGAIENLFDRRYVGSVTINGFGGRVLEPAAARQAYAGLEVRWAK
jgi:iron complex outermembrane receptor protein